MVWGAMLVCGCVNGKPEKMLNRKEGEAHIFFSEEENSGRVLSKNLARNR